MTDKDREDRFIAQCKKDFRCLSLESEMLLRYGFAQGAQELGHVAYIEGKLAQREAVLAVLGAAPTGGAKDP